MSGTVLGIGDTAVNKTDGEVGLRVEGLSKKKKKREKTLMNTDNSMVIVVGDA